MKTSYGIDLSERHLTLVRARGRNEVEVLVQSGAGRVPEGFARQIAAEVAAGRANCVAAIGCHEAVLRRVSAPFPGVERALKVFPSVLDVQLPFPLEQCATAFTALEANATGGTDALALAARREDVQRILQRNTDVGVDPVVLDHEGLALWVQAARETPAGDEDGRVVLHIGPAHSTLVYGRGPQLLGAHGARLGAGDAGDVAARARALATRVKTWLQAQSALGLTPRTRWIVTGVGATDQPLVAALRRELDLAAAVVPPGSDTLLARALASRGLSSGDLACNLRTGIQEHPAARRLATSRGRRHAVFALVAAAVLCLVNVGALYFASQRNDELQQRIQRLATQLAGSPAPRGQETLVVRRALEQQNVTYLPFTRVAAPGVSATLDQLLRTLGTNRIVASTMKLDADTLRFDARERDAAEVEQAVIDLKRAGWKLKATKTESGIAVEGSRR